MFPLYNCPKWYYTVYNCSNSLKKLDKWNLETNEITNFSNIFNNCSSIEDLDLSKLCTNNTIDINSMFAYCNSIEKFYIRLSEYDNDINEILTQIQ